MRKTVIFAATAGLALGLFGTVGANAMTSTSPAGARAATEALDTFDLARLCKCKESGSVEIRRGRHVGVGVEERDRSRTSIHSRTTTRGGTSVRGSTSIKSGESTKSSTKTGTSGKTGTTTSNKSGTSGDTSGRGQSGEKSSGGSGGSMGGSSGQSGGSSGQKQQ
jgi:hypothetical protein